MKFNIPTEHRNKSGIYAIKSLEFGTSYIGGTGKLIERFNAHNIKLRNNTHPNKKMQDFVLKNGMDSLEFILLELCSPDDLNKLEQMYLNLHQPNVFNIRISVESNKGLISSQESIAKRKASEGFLAYMERAKFVKDNIREEIRVLYLEGNLTQAEIGIKYNIRKRLVNKICSEVGIRNMRTREYKELIFQRNTETILDLYMRGATIYQLSKQFKISYVILSDLLKQHGVDVSASESRGRRMIYRKHRSGLSNEQIIEIKRMINSKIKTGIILDMFNIKKSIFYNIKYGFEYLSP